MNPYFSNKTRIYFLRIVFEFFREILLKYDDFQFNSNVKIKSGETETFVFFCPKHKIQTILNTLLVTICEIKHLKSIIPLYRLGYRIRMLCRDDNRFQTILHNLARNEFIMHHVYQKHSNPGGLSTRSDGSIFIEE